MNSPALAGHTIEPDVFALFAEFLGGYFDGGTHALGPARPGVKFPQADLRFQQSGADQPLDGLVITMVWPQPAALRRDWEAVDGVAQQRVTGRAQWQFWVRAAGAPSGSSGPAHQVLRGAQLLHALLNNSGATHPLAQRGVHHLRCGHPQAVAQGGPATEGGRDLGYALRMVPCQARLRWIVHSQPTRGHLRIEPDGRLCLADGCLLLIDAVPQAGRDYLLVEPDCRLLLAADCRLLIQDFPGTPPPSADHLLVAPDERLRVSAGELLQI